MNTRNLPHGNYTAAIDYRLYRRVPKSVFAAIALSPHFNGGAQLEDADTADGAIVREWRLLYKQGIVKQAPPSDLWLARHGVVLQRGLGRVLASAVFFPTAEAK
jgi:hypothetical protein